MTGTPLDRVCSDRLIHTANPAATQPAPTAVHCPHPPNRDRAVADDPPLDLPTRDGYDLWSAVYDADANPLPAIEEPCVDRLLGDVRGLAVLDLGCGTGRHALRLAAAGAVVTALDFSPGMLDQARAKPGAGRVA